MDPVEVVAAPYTIYVALPGTAFPNINASPSGSWFKLGTSGDKNYNEDGVVIALGQTIEVWRPAGITVPRKAWRTEESVAVRFGLVDMSPAQFAKVMDNATISTTAASAGVAGHKDVPLLRGIDVTTLALLARGKSSVDETLNAQLQIPIVYQNSDMEIAGKKGEPAQLDIEFMALYDTTDGVGKYINQTAPPS